MIRARNKRWYILFAEFLHQRPCFNELLYFNWKTMSIRKDYVCKIHSVFFMV